MTEIDEKATVWSTDVWGQMRDEVGDQVTDTLKLTDYYDGDSVTIKADACGDNPLIVDRAKRHSRVFEQEEAFVRGVAAKLYPLLPNSDRSLILDDIDQTLASRKSRTDQVTGKEEDASLLRPSAVPFLGLLANEGFTQALFTSRSSDDVESALEDERSLRKIEPYISRSDIITADLLPEEIQVNLTDAENIDEAFFDEVLKDVLKPDLQVFKAFKQFKDNAGNHLPKGDVVKIVQVATRLAKTSCSHMVVIDDRDYAGILHDNPTIPVRLTPIFLPEAWRAHF